MTKEQLEKRMSDLDISIAQTLANYNALNGARQECEIWLAKLKDEISDKSDKKVKAVS